MVVGKPAASSTLDVQVPSNRKYSFVAVLLITLFTEKDVTAKRRTSDF
jgi:hypothetical protein